VEIREKVVGSFFVDEEVDFYGLVDGTALVRPGGILNLYGLVTGHLHVLRGGVAVIHGTVTGFVMNAREPA
jgi:hypothetical protein